MRPIPHAEVRLYGDENFFAQWPTRGTIAFVAEDLRGEEALSVGDFDDEQVSSTITHQADRAAERPPDVYQR